MDCTFCVPNRQFRYQNFELADLKILNCFSHYPPLQDDDGCPCCTTPEMKQLVKNGQLDTYLFKAMTTWGTEDNFKHYLPKLLTYTYINKQTDDTFLLPGKLQHVRKWQEMEVEAINEWLISYVLMYYTDDFELLVNKSRQLATKWLKNPKEEIDIYFPYSSFQEREFEELLSFLSKESLDELSGLFDLWPQHRLDAIAAAFCFTTYQIDKKKLCDTFGRQKIDTWLAYTSQLFEESFWQSHEPHLQQLFSDAHAQSYFLS